jgi:hypothetical protein
MNTSKPSLQGAYPQRDISLERHDSKRGHPGVHLQMRFHQVENSLDIGSMYVLLEIGRTKEMEKIAEGFIYALYEMIGLMDEDFREMRPLLFEEDIVKRLASSKAFFSKKIKESITGRPIEVKASDGSKQYVTAKEIRSLIKERRELIPLLGDY